MMVRYKYREIMVEAFRDYIASEKWRIVKQEVMRTDNYSCADCQKKLPEGRGGIVHHKHYNDWGKGNSEEIISCIFLCTKCHNGRHAKQNMKSMVPFWAKQYPETIGVSDDELRDSMLNLHK
jgi:5-methylcytosine-specific restriction endonuclease McrA